MRLAFSLTCEYCGKKFISRGNSNQKACEDCRKLSPKEKARITREKKVAETRKRWSGAAKEIAAIFAPLLKTTAFDKYMENPNVVRDEIIAIIAKAEKEAPDDTE